MASLYTTTTISGYNATPPSDDGAQTTANEITWAKHKDKLADPIKTLVESINTKLVTALGGTSLNLDGTMRLDFDNDQDTSMRADNDDVIIIEVGASDSAYIGHGTGNTGAWLHIDPGAFTSTASTDIGLLRVGNTNAVTVPAGTTSVAAGVYIEAPNLTATGTITNTASLYIAGAATEGTNDYALWVDSGAVQLDGALTVGGAVTITSGTITGITDLAVADGGTGTSSLTNHGVLVGSGTGAVSVTAVGSSGEVLTSNGAGADPTFQATAGGGATTLDELTDVTITAAATNDFLIFTGTVWEDQTPAQARTAMDAMEQVLSVRGDVVVGGPSGVPQRLGGANAGQVLAADDSAVDAIWTDRVRSDTAIATTSGTQHDFTGIPSWVTKITISFEDVSVDAVANLFVRIGDSGGLEATGYVSSSARVVHADATDVENVTTAFIMSAGAAANTLSGHMILTNIDGNTWISSHSASISTTECISGGGSKTLSGVLDRLSVLSQGGSFDGGKVNIHYE